MTAPTPQQDAAYMLWSGLDDCLAINRGTTITTVTHWIENRGAGYPDVPLMMERTRDDATFWASCAHQFELEAYVAAGVMQLENSPITGKAAKRLAAMGFKAMDTETRESFKKWVAKQ